MMELPGANLGYFAGWEYKNSRVARENYFFHSFHEGKSTPLEVGDILVCMKSQIFR